MRVRKAAGREGRLTVHNTSAGMAAPAKRRIQFSSLSHYETSNTPPVLHLRERRSTVPSVASSSASRDIAGADRAPRPCLRRAPATSHPVTFVSSPATAPAVQEAGTYSASAGGSFIASAAGGGGDACATAAKASYDARCRKSLPAHRTQSRPDDIFRYFTPPVFSQLVSYFYVDELPLLSIVCWSFHRLLTSPRLLALHHLQQGGADEEDAAGQVVEDDKLEEEDEETKEDRQQHEEENQHGRQLHEVQQWQQQPGTAKHADWCGAHTLDGLRQLEVEAAAQNQRLIEEEPRYSLRVTDRLLHHLLLRECIRAKRREEAAELKRLSTLRTLLPTVTQEGERRTGSSSAGVRAHGTAVSGKNSNVVTRVTYRGKRADSDGEAEIGEQEQRPLQSETEKDEERKEEVGGETGLLGLTNADMQRYYEVGTSCVREGWMSALSILPPTSTLHSLPSVSSVFSATPQQQQQHIPRPQQFDTEQDQRRRHSELQQQQRKLHHQQQVLNQQQQHLQQQQQRLELQRQQSVIHAGELLHHQASHAYMQQRGVLPSLPSRLYFPGEDQQQRYYVYLPGEEQLQLQQPLEQQQQELQSHGREHAGTAGLERLRHVSTCYSTVPEGVLGDDEFLGYCVIEKILWNLGQEHAPLSLRQLVIDCNDAYTALPKLLQRAVLQQAPGMLSLHVYRCEEEKVKLLLTHALQHAEQLQEAALQLASGWTHQEAIELLAALLTGRGSRNVFGSLRSGIHHSSIRRNGSQRSSSSQSFSSHSSSSPSLSPAFNSFTSININGGTIGGYTGWHRGSSYNSGSQLTKLHVAGDCSLLLAAAHLVNDALQREALRQTDIRTQLQLPAVSALHALKYLNISHVKPVNDTLTQFVDVVKQLHVQFPRAQLGLDSIIVAEKAPLVYLPQFSIDGESPAPAGLFRPVSGVSGAPATASFRAATEIHGSATNVEGENTPTTAAMKKERKGWLWRLWRRRLRKRASSGRTLSPLPSSARGRTVGGSSARVPLPVVTESDSRASAAAGHETASKGSTGTTTRSITLAEASKKGTRRDTTTAAYNGSPLAIFENSARTTTAEVAARESSTLRAPSSAWQYRTSSPSSTNLTRRPTILTSLRRLVTSKDSSSFDEEQNVLSAILRTATHTGRSRSPPADDALSFVHASQLAACNLYASSREGSTLECLFCSLQEAVVKSYWEELQGTSGRCGGTNGDGRGASSLHCLLPSIGVKGSPRWFALQEGQPHMREVQLLLEQTQQYVLLLPFDFATAFSTALQQRLGLLKRYRHKVVGLELRIAAGDGAPLAYPRGVVDMVVRSLFSGQSQQQEKLRLLRLRAPASAAVLAGVTHEVACLVRNTPALRVIEITTPSVTPSRDRWFVDDRGEAVGRQLLLLLNTLEGYGFACRRCFTTPWLCVRILKRNVDTGRPQEKLKLLLAAKNVSAAK